MYFSVAGCLGFVVCIGQRWHKHMSEYHLQ